MDLKNIIVNLNQRKRCSMTSLICGILNDTDELDRNRPTDLENELMVALGWGEGGKDVGNS